jgi:hypothetical protein
VNLVTAVNDVPEWKRIHVWVKHQWKTASLQDRKRARHTETGKITKEPDARE